MYVWLEACSRIPQDDSYTVFTDINPSAEHHLQIVPKRHIGDVLDSHLTAYMLTVVYRKRQGIARC